MKDYLVIVIDSFSVQVILNGKTSLYKRFAVREKISSTHLEHVMIATLTKILQDTVRQTLRVDKIHIVLSSPWIVSKTKTSRFTYAKPLMLDREYLDQTIEQERTAFKKIFPFDIEFVEQKVFETKINGYTAKLKKPVPAMSLEISSAMSAMSKTVLKKIMDVTEHFFHGGKVSFHSSLILSYISLRHLQPELESGAFVNVHGECTDVTIFKNSVPTHFASTNFGSHTLVHTVAKSMNTSEGIAESKITLFEDGELNTQAEEKAAPLIEQKLAEWSASLTELMEQLEKNAPHAFVINSDVYETIFSNTLRNTFTDSTVTALPETIDALYQAGIELVEFHK